MNNLSSSLKKFIGNKNTVTIVGVLICLLILYFGYNYRISQQVTLSTVPYAVVDISPKTKITEDMIGYMSVPTTYLEESEYYADDENIIGKYSNINATIPKGSIFYTKLVIDEKELPDAIFKDIEDGYVLTQVSVNFQTTYANSIMPGNIIDIYFRAVSDDGKAMFGKFVENVEVLAMKDSGGNDVFGTGEAGEPAYMYVALPERLFILNGKVEKISSNSIDFMIVPNKVEYVDEDKDAIRITSEEVEKFINDRSKMIDSNIIDEKEDVLSPNYVKPEKKEENKKPEDKKENQ